MVEYKCFRCGYKGKQKIHLINHLKRKNICSPNEDDISIESIIKYYGFELPPNHSKITPNHSKITPNHSKMEFSNHSKITPNHSKVTKNHSKITPNHSKIQINKHICEYCNRVYTRKDNLTKHLKLCKEKNKLKLENEFLKDKVDCLQETVEKLLYESKANIINNTTKCDNITNNDNSTTINVITLNNYGSENTQYITKEYLMGLLEKPFESIPELIKYTHFNKEHPENQNIKLPNKKEPYVKILKDNKWELVDRKDTINDLIDQKHSMLNTVDVKNNFGLPVSNRIESFNNKYLNDDKELLNKLYKDSELVLLNNS